MLTIAENISLPALFNNCSLFCVKMNKKIVFCNCGATLIGIDRLEDISEYLDPKNYPYTLVQDLCGCAVDRKGEIVDLFNTNEQFLIIACYPRGINLLLENCGLDLQALNLSYLNFRELTNPQIFKEIVSFFEGEVPEKGAAELISSCEWPPWYPIIDHSRCNSCGQCADFCLYGVYEISDNKLVVVNPKGCKSNSPACARICPQIAIIFPKYEHPGAIAGSGRIDEIAEQQRQYQDIDAILGSNIYQALEMRKAKRKSIIRLTAMEQAILERDKALSEKVEIYKN